MLLQEQRQNYTVERAPTRNSLVTAPLLQQTQRAGAQGGDVPVGSEVSAFEQCSAVYELLMATHRDQALVYLMNKFGAELVNRWLDWRWTSAHTLH
jgi:hypothetical protein